MVLLASFNYYPPSTSVFVIGVVAGLAVLLATLLIGRIWFGIFAGLTGIAAITWVVLGKGTGDLTGLLQLVWPPIFGIAGAVLGGVLAGVGKSWRVRRANHGSQEQGPTGIPRS